MTLHLDLVRVERGSYQSGLSSVRDRVISNPPQRF